MDGSGDRVRSQLRRSQPLLTVRSIFCRREPDEPDMETSDFNGAGAYERLGELCEHKGELVKAILRDSASQ
jgi:hypothetical protein